MQEKTPNTPYLRGRASLEDCVHEQESRTGCKVQGEAAKEVAMNRPTRSCGHLASSCQVPSVQAPTAGTVNRLCAPHENAGR